MLLKIILIPIVLSIPTPEQEDNLISLLDSIYPEIAGNNNGRLDPATSLRLAFHSCFGIGCFGCLNINEPDNNGLNEDLDELYQVYTQNLDDIGNISFADFLNAAAVKSTVLLLGPEATVDGTSPLEYMKFNYGRTDCETVPYTDLQVEFPNGDRDWEHVWDLFHTKQFNFTAKEIVALIGGGHSVGDLNTGNSGYSNLGWDRSENRLDNDFFKMMTQMHWVQETSSQGKPEWIAESGPELVFGGEEESSDESDDEEGNEILMLNTDMSLLHAVPTDSNGFAEGTCQANVTNCGLNEITNQYVYYFAQDENKDEFIKTFVDTYAKMRNDGYAENDLVVLDRSSEVESTDTTSGSVIINFSIGLAIFLKL